EICNGNVNALFVKSSVLVINNFIIQPFLPQAIWLIVSAHSSCKFMKSFSVIKKLPKFFYRL
ncbi:MAG: hypothetical protein Q4G58_14830, partial [bacterium]|nr:hypothetical protein [bacterium]